MKKLLKSRLFFFILGSLIFSMVSVVFAYTYTANDIGFTPNSSGWGVTNEKEALDWLKWSDKNPLYTNFWTYVRAGTDSSLKAGETTLTMSVPDIMNNYKYFKVFDAISNDYASFCTYYAWSNAQQKLVQLTMNQSYQIASTTDGYQFVSLAVYTQTRLNNYSATCNVGFSFFN